MYNGIKKSSHSSGVAVVLLLLVGVVTSFQAYAHHVLGRPAYSLNEDSNTPPSIQVETQIGSYFVTYMVYPAFPKPNEAGRVNFYATRMDGGAPFAGDVTFTVRDDSWFSSKEEKLGVQVIDDSVYRQGFIFSMEGDYIITAYFQDNGEPYVIDFPLRVGDPVAVGPVGVVIGVVIIVLIAVNVMQRKRTLLARIRRAHEETST